MANEKVKWHPAFAAAIQLELKEYKEEGIRQLILKQYKKGLTVEYISDINDIDIEYVKKVVSRVE